MNQNLHMVIGKLMDYQNDEVIYVEGNQQIIDQKEADGSVIRITYNAAGNYSYGYDGTDSLSSQRD